MKKIPQKIANWIVDKRILVVRFDKLMEKSRKKSLHFQIRPVMKGVRKLRFVILPAAVLLVVGAYVFKDNIQVGFVKTFDNAEQTKIEDVFGVDNQTVILYQNDESKEHIQQLITQLENQPDVNYVQDYSNTIGKAYTYKELAEDMDMDESQAKLLFQLYRDSQKNHTNDKVTMYDMVCYLDENIAGNPTYADFMTDEQLSQIHDARKEMDDGKAELEKAAKGLDTAEQKLKDGETQIAENEKKLADAETQLSDSEAAYQSGVSELAANESKLTQSESQLNAGDQQLKESENEIAAGESQLAAAEAELSEKEQALTDSETQLQAAKDDIQKKETALAQSEQQLNAAKEQLNAGKNQLSQGKEQLAESQKKLKSGKAELASGKAQLEAAKTELADGWKSYEAGKNEYEDGMALYQTPMTAEELAEKTGRDLTDIEQMMQIYRMAQLDISQDTMQLDTFLDFILSEILPNKTYSAVIDADMTSQIYDGKAQLDQNRDLLLGEHYNRMIVSTDFPTEGSNTFAGMEEIQNAVESTLQESYLVGDSAMAYEMNNGFQKELDFVTFLTVIAVFVVVLFTFRSLFSSAILVAVIQGAVFITTAIVALQGYSVNYIALILVQCILMGATIDYGILLICNYVEDRCGLERMEALTNAMNRSVKTILTSSLILIGSCLSITFLMTQKIIAQTCTIIACGAAVSVIMVLFVLPAILYLTDKIIVRHRGK